jgi:hypothetical protein
MSTSDCRPRVAVCCTLYTFALFAGWCCGLQQGGTAVGFNTQLCWQPSRPVDDFMTDI